MLLHPFLHRVGAEAIFASVTGGPARRYDDVAVLTTATVGLALGIDTVEGSKHLRRAEAGAAVGLASVPELKTLRTRLGALADCSDPLGLQRAFAAGMLTADPAADPVYFVDDHFVPYSGSQPVGKGWNTKRPRPRRRVRQRGTVRAGLDPAWGAHPVAGGPRTGRQDPARLRPRWRLPERVPGLPRGSGGLGHLPARPAKPKRQSRPDRPGPCGTAGG